MAANSFSRKLAEMVFSTAKRPGKYLLSAIKQKAEREFQKIYHEQMLYQGTFLSKLSKKNDSANFDQIRTEIEPMSTKEQQIFINGEYTEATYKILRSMHHISRTIPPIYNPKTYSGTKDLLDPNMFPLQTTKSKDEYIYHESIWDNFKTDINPKLLKMVGHVLDFRPSSIQHPQAGNGVWIFSEQPVAAGSLLGFYAGVHHTKEDLQSASLRIFPQTELPYLLRHNGDAVFHDAHLFFPPFKFGFCCEDYVDRLEKLKKTLPVEVLPKQINPYALGHLINHPPAGTSPNVCFIDFEVPETLFPSFLLNHFPYMNQSIHPRADPTHYSVIGVISLCPLHNQELFVNYGTERFPDGYTPDWLEEPPDLKPISEYLCKENCVYEFSRLTKMLIRWDKVTMTETERIELELKEDREKKLKEALEDPELFAKYYKKKDD